MATFTLVVGQATWVNLKDGKMLKVTSAKDVGHFYNTSRSSPDSWIDKTVKLIEQHGGIVTHRAFGMQLGKAAYMLRFELDDNAFKVIWPVLDDDSSLTARRQAATMLYHDVKAKLMSAMVLGATVAFFQYWLLPDGRTASQLEIRELRNALPPMLTEVV